MIKAAEARDRAKAKELIVKQKYIRLADELIDKVIEPAIMEAVEHGLYKTEVVLGCDTETFRVVIQKLEEYEYYIASRNPISKSLVIDWEERTKPLTRNPENGIGETTQPVYREQYPNPMFKIT